jgi:hypothetical protein
LLPSSLWLVVCEIVLKSQVMTRDADTVFDIFMRFQKDVRGARYVAHFIESKAKLLRLDLDLWRMTIE